MKRKRMIFLILILIVVGFVAVGAVSHRLPPISHFEDAEFSINAPFQDPEAVIDGLAIYSRGEGDPVLLMPYPHAHTTEPMIQGPIADILVEMGHRVISFDVPGAYRSTRQPSGDITEMVSATAETLDLFEISRPIDLVGHSMGGLSALAFTLEEPDRVRSMVLVGSMAGFSCPMKNGLPKGVWKPTEMAYWDFILTGLRVKLGFGNLATHKKLFNIMSEASFHEKTLYEALEIDNADKSKGTPIREILWGKNMLKGLDFTERLSEIRVPVLLMAGKNDPQAPPICSSELQAGIIDAELVFFEESGHFPYLEENQRFISTLENFFE